MFTRLIERKKWPSKVEDTFDIIFFESHLNKKSTSFFSSKK
jgi:hypothetical protein